MWRRRRPDHHGPETSWREEHRRRYEITITVDPRDGDRVIDRLLPELKEFLRTRVRASVDARVYEAAEPGGRDEGDAV